MHNYLLYPILQLKVKKHLGEILLVLIAEFTKNCVQAETKNLYSYLKM